MKIRVVSSRDEIANLNPKERVVHLTFKPVALSILELTKRCPKLEAIEVAPSQFAKVSERSLCLLEVLKVKIFAGQIQGYRTDRAEYITVDDAMILQRAWVLQTEGMDSKAIVARVAREAGVSPGLVGFILKR